MINISPVLCILISCMSTGAMGDRVKLKDPIQSSVLTGNYVCKQLDDLKTIYSVKSLFHSKDGIAQKVAQRMIDQDRCQLLAADGLKAQISEIEFQSESSRLYDGYIFAFSVFTRHDGSSLGAWATIDSYPDLTSDSGPIMKLIGAKKIIKDRQMPIKKTNFLESF